jgi:PST family polysaccharide transporter
MVNRKNIRQFSTLAFSRIWAAIASLCVYSVIAQNLGPDGLGYISLVMSLGVMFSFISNIALDSVGLHSLSVDGSSKVAELFFVKLIFGVVALTFTALMLPFFLLDNCMHWSIMLVACFIHLLPNLLIESYYYSEFRSSRLAWAKIISTFVYLSGIVIGLRFGRGELYVIFFTCVEIFLYNLLILIGVSGVRLIRRLDFKYIKVYCQRAWPVAIATGMTVIYNRSDVLMLNYFDSIHTVGIFTAGIKISESTTFVCTLLLSVVYPMILKQRDLAHQSYLISGMLSAVLLYGLFCLVIVGVLAPFLIRFVYGSDFDASASILRVSLIAMIFSNLALASNYWLISKGLEKYRLYRALQSLLINVLLNLYLIPKYGAIGAVYSTVIAQMFAGYLGYILTPKTWPIVRLITLSITFKPLYVLLKGDVFSRAKSG